MCWLVIYNITTIIILDAGVELGPLLGTKETKTDGPKILPASSITDGNNTLPAVDVSNELNPDEDQTKENAKITKSEGPQIIHENSPTAGNAITALDTSNELNLDKVQTKERETPESSNIDAKSDQTSIPYSADQPGLSLTVPGTDQWRSDGNTAINSHCQSFGLNIVKRQLFS